MSPWHTIQLSSGQFIVCHGRTGNPLHHVCLIGSDGSVVKSFGGPPGSGSEQMDVPYHMAVDRNEFVFVVDLHNHRVLLLSPQPLYVMLCHVNNSSGCHLEFTWTPIEGVCMLLARSSKTTNTQPDEL